ncbi:MAG: hypothetical protein ACXWQO_03270 [Bdellovibrionota bacterium]
MKLLKWALVASAFLTSASVLAFEGTDRGNGGDEYSNAFINQALDVAEGLAQNPIPGVDAKAFQLAVQNTFVNSQERLVLRGNDVDAINIPDSVNPKILVSRAGWDRLETTPHRRAFLVLHEYLGIMGVDDSRYQISNRLDRAGVCERSGPIRNAIEMELHKSCYRIIQDDLKYLTSLWTRTDEKFEPKKNDFRGMPNLESLSFQYQSILGIQANAFELIPKLRDLSFDSSLTGLVDCGFLSRLPELRGVSFGFTRNPRYGNGTYLQKIQGNCFSMNKKIEHLDILVDAKEIGDSDFLEGFTGDIELRLNIHFINIASLNAAILAPANKTAYRVEIYSDDAEIPIGTAVAISAALPDLRCVTSSNPNNYAKHLIECLRGDQ